MKLRNLSVDPRKAHVLQQKPFITPPDYWPLKTIERKVCEDKTPQSVDIPNSDRNNCERNALSQSFQRPATENNKQRHGRPTHPPSVDADGRVRVDGPHAGLHADVGRVQRRPNRGRVAQQRRGREEDDGGAVGHLGEGDDLDVGAAASERQIRGQLWKKQLFTVSQTDNPPRETNCTIYFCGKTSLLRRDQE